MPLPDHRAAASLAQQRSKISNGTRTHIHPAFGGPDLRSRSARRWRDVYADLVCELGHPPSASEDALVRSCCDLSLMRETMSNRIAAGKQADPDELIRITSTLKRLLAELGLTGGGVAEPQAPSLSELMRGRP
jgi:hypothetical protein